VDVEVITKGVGSESFNMDGRAALTFDLGGKESQLDGGLRLKSLTSGTLQIQSLEKVIEKVRQNLIGPKKVLIEWFLESLRDYDYQDYQLDVQYHRPEGDLNFMAKGDLGSRKIDIRWHGEKESDPKLLHPE
jgi:hypothetical protein